ncbi:MAG: hypothetical protein SGARI_007625, partial [Bacillariaceae sp.]
MKFYLVSSFLLGAAASASTVDQPSMQEKLASRKLITSEGTVTCNLYVMDGTFESDALDGNFTELEQSFVCETSADQEEGLIGRSYDIALPPSLAIDNMDLIESGDAVLTVTNALKTRSYDANPD